MFDRNSADPNFSRRADPESIALLYDFIDGKIGPDKLGYARHIDIFTSLTPRGRKLVSPRLLSRLVECIRKKSDVESVQVIHSESLGPFGNWHNATDGKDWNAEVLEF